MTVKTIIGAKRATSYAPMLDPSRITDRVMEGAKVRAARVDLTRDSDLSVRRPNAEGTIWWLRTHGCEVRDTDDRGHSDHS